MTSLRVYLTPPLTRPEAPNMLGRVTNTLPYLDRSSNAPQPCRILSGITLFVTQWYFLQSTFDSPTGSDLL